MNAHPAVPARRRRCAARLLLAVVTAAAVTLALCPAAGAAASSPGPLGAPGPDVRRACAPATAGTVTCFAEVVGVGRSGAAGRAAAGAPITGLRPADIAAAYGLRGGSGGVVAIVDAQDNPRAEADLAVYRRTWHLPACTSANGCFRKVNQRGQPTPLPAPDPGWGLEIALDLDAASAGCPACSLLLVEADSPNFTDIGRAVDAAVAAGAQVVSNSYGADEFSGMASFDRRYYAHPGVPIVASSGDNGFGAAQFPAVLADVIGVGGTRLVPDAGSRGWAETVWSGGGSGCSAYIRKPAWQAGTGRDCRMRTVADVAAVADPQTGLAVRDTYGTADIAANGWLQVGGTSLSAPLISAMIVRAGRTASYSDASGLYARTASFHDIVAGSNGFCGGDYLCRAQVGYDAPTGVGTPDGLGGL